MAKSRSPYPKTISKQKQGIANPLGSITTGVAGKMSDMASSVSGTIRGMVKRKK